MPTQYKLTQPMHPGADRIVIHPIKGLKPNDRLEINGEPMTISSEYRSHESSLPGTVLVSRARDREVYTDHPAGSVVNVFDAFTSAELRDAMSHIQSQREASRVPPEDVVVKAPPSAGAPNQPTVTEDNPVA